MARPSFIRRVSQALLAFLCLGPGVEPKSHSESFSFITIAGVANDREAVDGTNTGATFLGPTGVSLGPGGDLFIADGSAIRRASPSGTNWIVTTLAGTAPAHGAQDGTNTDAYFNAPYGLVSSGGSIFIADTLNHAIRKMVATGTNWVVNTIAGQLTSFGSGDGTNGFARFKNPYGITADGAGNLYVSDTYNNLIRKVTPSGTNWVVTTIAGVTAGGTVDGTNTDAKFKYPVGITADGAGNLFVSDFQNHTIRKLRPSGTNWITTTIAGLAGFAGSSDGSNTAARFSHPQGIAVSPVGYIYVADNDSNIVRVIKPFGTNWVVKTIAGLAGNAGSSDGTGSGAQFTSPVGICVSPAGTLFLTESINLLLRQGKLAVLLDFKVASGKGILSWPIGATGYVAQTSSRLINPNWTAATNPVTQLGDTCFVTNNVAGAAGYFRLFKP